MLVQNVQGSSKEVKICSVLYEGFGQKISEYFKLISLILKWHVGRRLKKKIEGASSYPH